MKNSYENSHIPPAYGKQCVFMMNQKHVFGYRFLVTNRNVFEGHENTPHISRTVFENVNMSIIINKHFAKLIGAAS